MRPKSCEKVSQNSFLFQLKFSMLLSAMVQMKNSLIKYLDYEKDSTKQPEMQIKWDDDSVYTPTDTMH